MFAALRLFIILIVLLIDIYKPVKLHRYMQTSVNNCTTYIFYLRRICYGLKLDVVTSTITSLFLKMINIKCMLNKIMSYLALSIFIISIYDED